MLTEVWGEFRKACSSPAAQESNLCAPNPKAIVSILTKAKVDVTGERFQQDLSSIVRDLSFMPPAWSGIAKILDPKHPWTQTYPLRNK